MSNVSAFEWGGSFSRLSPLVCRGSTVGDQGHKAEIFLSLNMPREDVRQYSCLDKKVEQFFKAPFKFCLRGPLDSVKSYTPACHCIVLYCIVSIYLYSASCSAHQLEALPVRETQREESSVERTKRRTWHTS